MKPCHSKINQSRRNRGKTRNKMEGPTSKKTDEPPKRENHKRNIWNKERGGPPERTPNLDKPSPTTPSCLKIEIACACCNTTNTFCLSNVCKLERRGPLVPFTTHTMLAYQWRNPSTSSWCRHPKSSTTRGRNMSVKNRSWQKVFYAWVVTIAITLQERLARKTKLTEVGLMMIMFAHMRTPSTDNTMSTQWHENCRARCRRTWVCFHDTWNLAYLAMALKAFRTTPCEVVLSPPWT
jgi:hypothetical protein